MPFRHLSALALAATFFAGCDLGDPTESLTLSFQQEFPRTIAAGDSLRVTVRGQSTRPFGDVDVLVFRGSPRVLLGGGLVGDTLFAERLDATVGERTFTADAVVVVPRDLVTQAVPGEIWIASAFGASGQDVQIVPAP